MRVIIDDFDDAEKMLQQLLDHAEERYDVSDEEYWTLHEKVHDLKEAMQEVGH